MQIQNYCIYIDLDTLVVIDMYVDTDRVLCFVVFAGPFPIPLSLPCLYPHTCTHIHDSVVF